MSRMWFVVRLFPILALLLSVSAADVRAQGPSVSRNLLEGYFVEPTLPPPDPDLGYFRYDRPIFRQIDWPIVPTRFCSQAERDAFLVETYRLLQIAEQNARLAYLNDANLSFRANRAMKGGAAAEAAVFRAEQLVAKQLLDHHSQVRNAWWEIYEHLVLLPVVECQASQGPPPLPYPEPSERLRPGMEGYFPDPIVVPPIDLPFYERPAILPPGWPPVPLRFCHAAEKAAYLAELAGAFAIAEANLAVAVENLQFLKNEVEIQRGRGNAEAAQIYAIEAAVYEVVVEHLRDVLIAWERIRVRLEDMAVADCRPPRDPSLPPARPTLPPADSIPALPRPRFDEPVAAPVLPSRFCTEAERLAFLTDVYHPVAQRASRNAVAAARYVAELSARIDQAVKANEQGPALEALRREYAAFAPLARYYQDLAERLIRMRDDILRIPLVPCPSTDATRPPPSGPAPPPVAAVRPSTNLEAGVLAEINLLRSNPAGYADYLSGVIPGIRRADVEAAIQVLRGTAPVPVLEFDSRLAGAAIVHANDIGPRGLTSHTGTDGSTLGGRIRAQGLNASLTAEELSYGQTRARAVVVQLVIDAGVPGAPHRRDLLNPVFRRGGVGCGPHKTYGQVCVITMSGPPLER